MPRVLLAEDSPIQARQVQVVLEDRGFDVELAKDGTQALGAIERSPPDIVLTDLEMPEMNGLELVQAVRTRFPSVPVVLMTAHGSEEVAAQALQQGAASYIPKRKVAREVVATLEKIIGAATAERGQLVHVRGGQRHRLAQQRLAVGRWTPGAAPAAAARTTAPHLH